MGKKIFAAVISLAIIFQPCNASASPWKENKSYLGQTGGKLAFGLKNSLLGWMTFFVEAKEPEYSTEWNGFCVGLARSVANTGAGLIQLVTFPVPLDFPDVGKGIHLPEIKPTPKKTAAQKTEKPAAKKADTKTEITPAPAPSVEKPLVKEPEPPKAAPIPPPPVQAPKPSEPAPVPSPLKAAEPLKPQTMIPVAPAPALPPPPPAPSAPVYKPLLPITRGPSNVSVSPGIGTVPPPAAPSPQPPKSPDQTLFHPGTDKDQES